MNRFALLMVFAPAALAQSRDPRGDSGSGGDGGFFWLLWFVIACFIIFDQMKSPAMSRLWEHIKSIGVLIVVLVTAVSMLEGFGIASRDASVAIVGATFIAITLYSRAKDRKAAEKRKKPSH